MIRCVCLYLGASRSANTNNISLSHTTSNKYSPFFRRLFFRTCYGIQPYPQDETKRYRFLPARRIPTPSRRCSQEIARFHIVVRPKSYTQYRCLLRKSESFAAPLRKRSDGAGMQNVHRWRQNNENISFIDRDS
jgi:hypothetical protein